MIQAAKIQTTNQKLYIIDIEGDFDFSKQKTYERLEIQFLPDMVQNNRKANITDLEVVGRNDPLHHFTGGSETLSFELDFYADTTKKDDVIKKVRWLQSLAINDGNFGKASRVVILWGDFLKGKAKWVITEVNAKYTDFQPKYNFLPCQAFVTVSFKLDTNYNLTKKQLRQ